MKRISKSKENKRLYRLLLGIAILSLANGNIVQAEGSTDNDYTYKLINGYTEIEITKYNGSDDMIVIPGEIDGTKVTSIGDEAFDGCTSLRKVVFKNKELILSGNFTNCPLLKTAGPIGGNYNIEYPWLKCTVSGH